MYFIRELEPLFFISVLRKEMGLVPVFGSTLKKMPVLFIILMAYC